MPQHHPDDPIDPMLEARVTARLARLADTAGPPPAIWPLLQARLTARPPRRRLRRWGAGAAAALMLLTNPVAYLVPRVQWAVEAMGHPVPAAAWGGQLTADPGLFGLWSAGALAPLRATTTRDGVTLTVLGTYFDARSSVLVVSVHGPAPGGVPAGAVAQRWRPVSNNDDLVAWQTGSRPQSTPPFQQYLITLSNQFGLTLPAQTWFFNGDGVGAFTFPGFPAWMRQAGLRLTLRVGAMEAVVAPEGPLGGKTVHLVPGPWTVAFSVIPPPEPNLTLSPDTQASTPQGTLTLTQVQDVPSGSWMTVSSTGAVDWAAPGVRWSVTTPAGHTVSPLGWQAGTHGATLRFPPLTAAGTYRLTGRAAGTQWTVSWTQPAWDAHGKPWQAPAAEPPIYQGTDWNRATRLVGFPALPPPAGTRLVEITVASTTTPLRSPDAVPRQLSMVLQTPDGPVQVIESPAWLTPVPAAATAAQFAAALRAGSPPGRLQSLTLHGMPAQLWTLPEGPPTNGTTSLLDLYPTWGSIQLTPWPGHRARSGEVLPTAQDLLQFADALTTPSVAARP
ncbi:MAG: hypothetical protein K6V97_14750 [Actinomycetia bacterium]|nr:hypothetical protein [Actinomycetes bacterium]